MLSISPAPYFLSLIKISLRIKLKSRMCYMNQTVSRPIAIR